MPLDRRFIQSFTKFPKEIFRLNSGPQIRLRAHPAPHRPRGAFDLLTVRGVVRPLALDPGRYECMFSAHAMHGLLVPRLITTDGNVVVPNGASMRPNTAVQQRIVRAARGVDSCVYCVDAGTELPDDLILAHEFRDHYSLQARREMSVADLNEAITHFLSTKGRRLSREEWLGEYPRATEPIYS